MNKNILFLLLVTFSTFSFSQTAPTNTRLFQINTLKGSVLSLVELSENFAYHIGTSNSSEVGFDGLSATTVGLDDLYILKSDVENGANLWFKTFNAGTNGAITPRYAYVDDSENIYVFAQFKGTITVGSVTATAANPDDTILLKIDSNGNALWVRYFPNGYNSRYKTKLVTDGLLTFLVYNNRFARINDLAGNVIYDRTFNCELTSIAYNNSELFLSGTAFFYPVQIGSEVIEHKAAFVVKGDKEGIFLSSLKTSVAGNGSVISDIAFDSEGKLLLSGFSTAAVDLLANNQTYSYTYNPNSTFVPLKVYNFTAKIDRSLSSPYFFRSSGPIGRAGNISPGSSSFSASLLPNGNGFALQLKIDQYQSSINPIINANSSSTTFNLSSGYKNLSVLTLSDKNGNYINENQPLTYGFPMGFSRTKFSQTNQNTRLFNSTIKNIDSESLLWTKTKTASNGGTVSKQFHKHLQSAKNDQFVSVLVEGKANFFGKKFDIGEKKYSRAITRLGIDGQPKWFADFSNDSGREEYGINLNFATVDKDDNLFILCNMKNEYSVFTDAAGTPKVFNSPYYYEAKILLKLDKNGILLWSKILENGNVRAGIKSDNVGDLYIIADGGYTIDNYTVQGGNITLAKITAAGNLVYGKGYQQIGNYSFIPAIDAQNNLYVFSETFGNSEDYNFDGVIIPANNYSTDHLMLKFNSAGNVIWGKNFYANATSANYSWPNDIVFDGQNFVMLGNLYGKEGSFWSGLDLQQIDRKYPNIDYIPFIAKISPTGTVVWQEAINSNNTNTGAYTNINVDQNKNIYTYFYGKDLININNTTYYFNAVTGNKILLKMDSSGFPKYLKAIDNAPYASNHIDVFGDDKINVSGYTVQNSILNYPINYNRASSLYIATFGNLDSYYMSATKDYLVLNNVAMSTDANNNNNNNNNNNTFSFDLINNVNWNATSDQPWLNLSFVGLTGRSPQQTITGTGDAKITLTADQNTTGATRSSNVIISGENVPSKTIIVTQSGLLKTGETKTFVTTLYPNPTSDFLHIKSDQKISKVEIYDMSGKLVKSENLKDEKVNVRSLLKGNYLLKIQTERGVVSSKFIKN